MNKYEGPDLELDDSKVDDDWLWPDRELKGHREPVKLNVIEQDEDIFDTFRGDLLRIAHQVSQEFSSLNISQEELELAVEVIISMISESNYILKGEHRDNENLMDFLAHLSQEFLREDNSADQFVAGEELFETTYAGKLVAALSNNGFLVTVKDRKSYFDASVRALNLDSVDRMLKT